MFMQILDIYCLYMHHSHTPRLTALCPGLPGWAGTRKVKPIWILMKQETVTGSEIRWDICKSAHCSRQITTPAPHRSVFYRPDALPAAQPTASKHWRHIYIYASFINTKLQCIQQWPMAPNTVKKKLCYDRRTTSRAVSVKIWLTAARL